MKVSKKLTLALVTATTVAVSPGAASLAQEGNSTLALEEIIVNARKRDETLQSVPVAVDVFSEARLEQLGVFNVQDIARFSSGLQFDQGVLPTDTRPVIRGAISFRGRPNAGVMVDFVDVSSEALTVGGGGITTNLRLLDLERVEIVKGPQSALYGRSAFTGAVNYVTRRPSETLTGNVSVAAEDFGTTDISASLSGPLTDTFRASVMLNKYDTDGWYENPNTGGQLGAVDSSGGSLALEWDISEKLTSFFRAEYTETEATPRAEVLVPAMDTAFDPMINFLGTGTVTDDAVQFPHMFEGEICNTIDRVQPYFDSFGLGPTCRPLNVGEQFGTEADIDLSADPRTGADFLGSTVDTLRVHFDIDYEFDNANLKYILGYLDNDTFIQEDFDKNDRMAVSVPFVFSQYGLSAMSQQSLEMEQWNHELRLTGESERTSWMLSLLNWREDVDLAFDDEWWLREGADPGQVLDLLNATVFSFLQGGPVNPILGIQIPPPFCDIFYPTDPNCVNAVTSLATGPGDTPATPITRSTNHWSLAGMVVYNFNEDVSATLEGRIIREEIDYAGRAADVSFYSQFGADPYWGFLFGPGEWTTNNISETAFTPKLTVDWAVSENVMLYGYFAHAFKPGGVATTDANGDVSTGEYKPEKLDAWELGFKGSFRDRSIRWNGAFFYYDYTDQQVPFQFFSEGTTLLQTGVINAGETEIKGFETDLVWRSAFLDGLSVNLGYTFTDAEFTSFNLEEILAPTGATVSSFNRAKAGNAQGDFTGKTPPLTAEHSATGSIRYDLNFGSSMFGFAELLGSYKSERFLGEGNRTTIPAVTLWDFYAGIGSDNWSLTAYVQNAADEDKPLSGVGNVGLHDLA